MGSEFESRHGKNFSPPHVVLTGSGAHPASYLMGTGGGLFSGVKWPGREVDYSHPTSAEVKNTCICIHLPHRKSSWRSA
jgi:hypothetical protein